MTRTEPTSRTRAAAGVFLALTLFLVACTGSDTPSGAPGASMPTAVAVPQAETMDHGDMSITVYASPTCGCCHEYVPYLEQHGFKVKTVVTEDTNAVKERYGIPPAAWSCHTAVVGDYFVEGHVPIDAIMKLLDDQPKIDGISLPGMPLGSPGMNGEKAAPFEVVSIKDGAIQPFLSV